MTPPSDTSPTTFVLAIADSGSTDFLLRVSHLPSTLTASGAPIRVELPNGSFIQSLGYVHFIIPHSKIKITAHIFPDHLLDHNLASMSQLCAQGCSATFDSTSVTVRDSQGCVVLSGTKALADTLWHLPIPLGPTCPSPPAHPPNPSASLAIKNQLDADFVQFAHAAMGSPCVSTFYKAVQRGYLRTMPRLTAKMIHSNPPNSTATALGHLDRQRQGLASTKQQPPTDPVSDLPFEPDSTDDAFHSAESPDSTDNNDVVYTMLMKTDHLNSSDLTGRFPVTSRRGHSYIHVSVWRNYIHCEPQKTKSSADHINSYSSSLNFFKEKGNVRISIQRLDNETSQELEQFLHSHVDVVQYVPPHQHRANKAERAIRDVKNHLIACLCTTDRDFPLNLFDAILPQMEITLNLLRPSALNPSISAYEGLYGAPYDFTAHPIAPIGTRVVVYEGPDQRASWATHGVKGFYLGPSLQHHRTFRTWIPSTQRERQSSTLAWFPQHFLMPGSSPLEMVHAAIRDLTSALTTLSSSTIIPADSRALIIDTTATLTDNLLQVIALFQPADFIVPSSPSNNETTPTQGSSVPPAEQRVPTATAEPPHPAAEQRVPLAAAAPPHTEQRVTSPIANVPTTEVCVTSAHPADPIIPTIDDEAPLHTEHWVRRSTRPARSTINAAKTARPNVYAHTQTTSATLFGGPNVHLHPQSTFTPTNPLPFAPTANTGITISKPTHHAFNSITDANLNLDDLGVPLTFTSAINGPNRPQWEAANLEELIRLVDSGTIQAIHSHEQPVERRADTTYYNRQVREKLKDGVKSYRVRGTAGGDRINYPGDVTARTADLTVVKLLLHSVISDDVHFMTADIKDFYLGTPLARPEYVRIPVKTMPDVFLDKYDLRPHIFNGSILFQINKGMYGLPQAGLLAQQRLVAHLAAHGYVECPQVPCLFRHLTRSVTFSLVVDDFGIKFTHREDADHLLACLRELYAITVDWSGSKYLGISIKFDRVAREVSLSMPGYVRKALARFAPSIKRGAASPMIYVPPTYGSPVVVTEELHPPLSTADTLRAQQIIGVFLYYARAVDPTMLTAVNAIGSDIATGTTALLPAIDRLLAYAASYPNNELVFTACDMVLHIQSDASYLSRSGSRSVAGGYFYLGHRDMPTHINGAVHCTSNNLDVIVAAASEAEYGAVFFNGQTGVWLRTVLLALGYLQPATILLCDNDCAVGIANNTVKLRRSKAIDVRFHWIRDRIKQEQFRVLWRKGANNLADFFTKALPVHAHQALMPFLVRTPVDPNNAFHNKRAQRANTWRTAQLARRQ